MTFEYRDAYGRVLTADHGLDDDDNPIAVLWSRGEFGASVPVRIPADRVEEVVAGIRDAARTAAARQTTGQDDTDHADDCTGCTADTPCDVRLRAQSHADGEHELCGAECPAVGQPAEAHDTDRAAILDEAIKAVLGRVRAWEGMDHVAVRLNQERAAIAELLRRMAVEGER